MRFLDAINIELNKGNRVVIPDIKCYSPKDGDLLQGRDPVAVAMELVAAGAVVCSVVTEEKEFGGSMELLRRVCEATKVPVLRKDFIHTKEDLIETKEAGASAILLMCSCLEPEEMKYLYGEALEIGLDPFVETHNEEEMQFAISLGAELIGINNRNILELERDDGNVNTTSRVIQYAPEQAVIVSESSIMNARDVNQAFSSGADVALIGTAIWKAQNLSYFYRSLTRKTRLKICGIMRPEDVKLCMEYGTDVLGFVCEYPKPVPWNMNREQVKQLVDLVPPTHLSCIVVGGEEHKILELADYVHPDLIQIHYKETIEQVSRLTSKLHDRGIRVVKSVPPSEEGRLELFGTADIAEIVKLLCEAQVDEILLDAREASNAERYGLNADVDEYICARQLLATYEHAPDLVLAGGITPDNLEALMKKAEPTYIDIMTGVEAQVGIKDEEKMKRMVMILNHME